VRAELGFLFTWRGMVEVGVAVLEQVDPRLAPETIHQRRGGVGRHHGQCQRHLGLAMEREKPVERRP
jgi:hypothetical protein